MKVVIADTSPINYLILIDCVDLLRVLYRCVVIPVEVFEELTAAGAPPKVASWIQDLPGWIEVRPVSPDSSFLEAVQSSGLDARELAAIQLALAGRDSLLLIDEAAGRLVADRLGIPNAGALGVLVAGAKEGLVHLRTSREQVQTTSFRVTQSLIDKVLAEFQHSA